MATIGRARADLLRVTLALRSHECIDGYISACGTHHESGEYLDSTHSAVFPGRHPAFWKTDVSLTYKAPGDRWTLSIWGRNLENSATYSAFTPAQQKSAGVVIGSYANVYVDSPRTYGARVGVSF